MSGRSTADQQSKIRFLSSEDRTDYRIRRIADQIVEARGNRNLEEVVQYCQQLCKDHEADPVHYTHCVNMCVQEYSRQVRLG